MRAAIYLRQSRDPSQTGLAVTRQRKDCAKLAADRGWTIEHTLTDNDVSASSGKHRPAFAQLLALIDDHAIDVVICWHVDRLTRRLADLEDVIDRCQASGVRLATVSGDLDLGTDAGRLVGRILASVARGEVERKSARQKAAARQAAERGRPPSRRAFGYAPGGMAVIEDQARAVREAYEQLLAGASLVTITARMNAAGHKSTRGHTWSRTMARAMLLSSRYAGIRTYRGEEIGPGAWPPIVPEEVWRATVALLGAPERRTNHGTARRWIGGGLYLCGRCGSDVRVGYRENRVRIYICRTGKHLTRTAEPIDALIAGDDGLIVARLARADVLDLLAAPAPDVAPLREESNRLRCAIDQAATDYADGALTARQVRVATDRLTARLKLIERQLAAAGTAGRLSPLATAADPVAVWDSLDVGARRTVIDTLCTITLLPTGAGRRAFDPESVDIAWRTS